MIFTCPPSMSEHLAVVPPMSSASTFGVAEQPAELGRAPEAARRPRLDHRDRDLLRLLDRVDAAVRLHDVELPVEAAALEPSASRPR